MRPLLQVALLLSVACADPGPRDVKRLAAFSDEQGAHCPERAARADVPAKDEWQKLLAAFAAEPATDGAFEVVSASSGCARLVERRAGGAVKSWELWRKTGRTWALAVSWELAPGVKRPTAFRRAALAGTVEGGGELSSPELVSKRIDGEVWTKERLLQPCPGGMTHCPGHGPKSFDGLD